MTLVRTVSAERWWQKTLDGMKKERTLLSFKKLDFEGEKKNKDGAGGGSFWSLLFCCVLVGKT